MNTAGRGEQKSGRSVPGIVGRIALAMALGVVPLAVACSSAEEAVEPETASASIINGRRDAEHPAVVALTMQRPAASGTGFTYSSCTGTIIKADAETKIAYVLTAAHCVRSAQTIFVSQTSNTAAPASGISRYGYLDHTSHPSYNGATSSPYDIAMVRVLGASETTPVMPMMAPDTLVQGQTRVTSVGFGRTVRPNQPLPPEGPNTFKNRIDGRVTTLRQAQLGVTYDNGGDICQGDSGGPVIATVSGKEFVVGVHSFVTGPCVGQGWSVRAAAHDAFVKSVLNAPVPEETCELCRKKVSAGTQVCAEARKSCLADAQCSGLRTCLSQCTAAAADAGSDAGASDDCKRACSVEFPFGAAPYNQQVLFFSCRECGATCGGERACAGVPKCGMKQGSDTCNSCLEGACCAESAACGADGLCYRCVRNPETPGCADSARFQALQVCKAGSCDAACAAAPAADEASRDELLDGPIDPPQE